MTLRLRFALTFAAIALGAAAVVALVTPFVVGRGFAALLSDETFYGGMGRGMGAQMGMRAQLLEQQVSIGIVAAAVGAAIVASVIGWFVAGRIVRPIEQLEVAADAVAGGDLTQRSGIASRPDELGRLGRSFDVMAQELDDADAARRRFLQDVAHELRTPLSVIEATTSAILDGVYQHDAQHLETVRSQGRLLSRIVDDLRTISLAEGGHLPLRREPISAAVLADRAVSAFEARASAAGVRLRHEPAATTPAGGPSDLVDVDPDRIGQVLGALIDNALRHTPAGGEITLRTATDVASHRVAISVDDTGPGITPDDLPHLFDRFYQADTARDRRTGTSGLGLAIVRALVEAHDGQVSASNLPGHGARFTVELPAAA